MATKEEDSELALAIELSLEQCRHEIKRKRSAPEEEEVDHDLDYAIARSLVEPTAAATWTCEICIFTNGPLSEKCAMCGSKRFDGSVLKRGELISWEKRWSDLESCETDRDIDEAIARSLVDAEEHDLMLWRCALCSFGGNAIFLNKCDSCLSLKQGSDAVPIIDSWPCPRCTFDSPTTASSCEVCGFSCEQNVALVSKWQQCGLPGCPNEANATGFCCQGHINSSLQRQVIAPSEIGVDRVLVGPSGDFTCHLLTKSHPMHSEIKQLFLDSWLKRDTLPAVMRIFKIRVAHEIHVRYRSTAGRLQNTQLRFHGTSQLPSCTFGKNPASPPCNDDDCRVCSISRTSFSLQRAGESAGMQMALRYGRGIYFSATSSKSNDYSKGSEIVLRQGDRHGRLWAWRCMFVCHVAIGNTYRTTDGSLTDDMCPPHGYDSVTGEVGPHLNYDEVVAYDESQAVPSYLVVYTIPPGR